jgi:hypothetical protein
MDESAGGSVMINRACLPTWESIFTQTGLKPLRRARGPCPFCNSGTGFSCHEEKGFHCFACGVHGDKISFVQQFHRCGFKDALRFFSLEAGKPPAPDPTVQHHNKLREGLQHWAHALQRKLRDEFYFRSKIEYHGTQRLKINPEDSIGWELLSIAYTGIPLDELEKWLDLLIGTEAQQLEAYKTMRNTA